MEKKGGGPAGADAQ